MGSAQWALNHNTFNQLIVNKFNSLPLKEGYYLCMPSPFKSRGAHGRGSKIKIKSEH